MYEYGSQKKEIFSEKGQQLFLGIRDQVHRMLEVSGACTMGKAMRLPCGVGAADSWDMMACVDRLVELGELKELPTVGTGQDRVFVDARRR